MALLVSRLVQSLTKLPGRQDWFEFLAALLGYSVVFGSFGFASGLFRFSPVSPWEATAIILIAFFAPALGEEVVFRGFLPSRGQTRHTWAWIAGSTALFVVWHVLEALVVVPKAAHVFLRPDFLLMAGGLGSICAILRYRSDSLWPPVLLHWVLASVWLTLLGGPSVADLG